MKKTKLSIIVPVYNSLLYLPRCIESMVVAQNVQDRIEIILIDDGSNDGTEKLVDMFASRYSNIKVIHENNSGGPAHPRNVGLSIANGEYVFFCDNDDYFAPHALEKMIKHADEWKPDVMAVKIGDDGSREIIARSMFKENNSDVDIYRSTISKTLGPWKLYKRSFLQKNNFEFPIDCPDDNPFVLKAYLLANRVSVAADQDYYYWTEKTDKSNLSNQDNSTWFNFEKKYLCTEKCFKIYEEYADKKLGQIYMLPRLLEWPTWTFQGIILLNDKETPKLKEYITNLRKMLLSVCDEEFLKKKAKLEEYVTLKTLIDYKDFDVAKRILMDYQKSKWKTLECGKEGTFYSLANKKFIIDADYFIKPVVDVLDVEYMQNNLYLNCEITTSNFTPKEIHNSKIILKKYKSDIQYEYADFVLEANEDGKYTLNTKIDLSTFICYLNKNNDNSKSVRWDIALQIGKNYTKRLNITNETTLFTKFSNYLYVEKEKVLVPHVSDGEVMCFWYIVEKSNDFSKEFFKYKKNRSLVNLLSVNLISQSDFDIITKLHKEYKKGKINLKIISNEEIKYCGKKYKVGYPAFIESCIYDRRGYHALKKK